MKTNKSSAMKKVLVLLIVLSLVFTACGSEDGGTTDTGTSTDAGSSTDTGSDSTADSDSTDDGAATEFEKPEKITIMVDGTLVTKANGRAEFEAEWEALTGIDLEIIQPDHDAYTDNLGQVLASGEWPDVMLLNSAYYAGYADEGVLWDMTAAYDNSDLKTRVKDQALVEGLKIDGSLYGLSPSRGNGCITYIKKAWLDNVGLDVPTNYDEYVEVMDAFTNGDPDGNGIDGDTGALSSAGLIGEEIPFINYLPEFYQDAFPSFYINEDGQWADGFVQDNFIGALERLRDAYQAGYIDKEALTNGTSDVRNKFYEDKFGIFTYWAGTWATNLKTNLEANGLDGELIAMEPIEEVGAYLERQAPTWAITSQAENPEAIFEYFFETMLDGGLGQKLFTYGAEGTHWSTEGGELLGVTYEDGQFHMLENMEKAGTLYTKNHIDPMMALTNFTEFDDPGILSVAEEALVSAKTFGENSRLVELVPSSEVMSQYNGDLVKLKREIVANVVLGTRTIEEEMQRFEDEGGLEWSQMIVDSLNE